MLLNSFLVLALSNRLIGKRAELDESLFEIYYDDKLVMDRFDFLISDSNSKQDYSIPFDKEFIGYYNGIVVKPILQDLEEENHLIINFEISNHNSESINFIPKVRINNYDTNNTVIQQKNGFLIDNVAILNYFGKITPESPSNSYFGDSDKRSLIFEWDTVELNSNDKITLNLHIVATTAKTSKRHITQDMDDPELVFDVRLIADNPDNPFNIHLVHAYTQLNFVGRIFATKFKENITVQFSLIMNDNNIELPTVEITTGFADLNISLPFPKKNGRVDYSLSAHDGKGHWATDQYWNSNIAGSFEVVVKPGVYIVESLDNVFNAGDDIVIHAFLGDYEPGTQIALGYHVGDEDWSPEDLDFNITNYYTIDKTWRTDYTQIKLDFPQNARWHYLYIFAVDIFLDVQNLRVEKIWLNEKPNVTEWKPINETYYMMDEIHIEAKAYDDSTVFLKYYFDSNPIPEYDDDRFFSDHIGWAAVERNQSTIYAKIQIPISLNEGPHSLIVFAKDFYNQISEIKQYNFTIVSGYVPYIEIHPGSETSIYSYHDVINFNGIYGFDQDDNLTIVVEYESTSETLELIPLSSRSKIFSLNITNPHEDKDFIVSFRVSDNSSTYSKTFTFPVSIRRKRECIVTTPIENSYISNTNLTITGYVTDFDPNENITISYMINGIITQLKAAQLTIGQNYMSPNFTFQLQLPSEDGLCTFQIWAESSKNKTYYNNYNIEISSPPTILEWLDFNSEVYQSELVEIKLRVKSKLPVQMCMQIDDEEENCPQNSFPPNNNNRRFFILPLYLYEPSAGNYQVHVCIQDTRQRRSETLTKSFTISETNIVPNIVVSNIGGNYSPMEEIHLNYKVDQSSTIFMHVGPYYDDSFWKEIDTAEVHQLDPVERSVSFQAPREEGSYICLVTAAIITNDGDHMAYHRCPFSYFEFNVKTNRPVIHANNLEDIDYSPGEVIELNFWVSDFKPNSTGEVYFSFNNDINGTLIENVHADEFGNSPLINLTINVPNYGNGHYLMIWAQQDLKSEIWFNHISINYNPKLVLNNPEIQTYTKPAHININITVYDEHEIRIFYKIKENGKVQDEEHIIDTIGCYGNSVTRILDIVYDGDTSTEIELIIYTKNLNDEKSNEVAKKIIYDAERKSPEIKLISEFSPEEKSPIYLWGDIITTFLNISDQDDGFTYSIMYRYSDLIFRQEIMPFQISRNSSRVNILEECEFPSFPKNGLARLSVQVIRDDGAISNTDTLDIRIQRREEIEFVDGMNDAYDIDRENSLTIMLLDFERNSKVRFTMYVSDPDWSISKVVDINDNYRSDEFKLILPKHPIGKHIIKFTVTYNSLVLSQKEFYVTFKQSPKLKVDRFKSNYRMNDHIDIHFSIEDSYPVDITYEIKNRNGNVKNGSIKEQFNPNGKLAYFSEQIQIDEKTFKGKGVIFEFKLYAKDNFNLKTERKFDIYLDENNKAPAMKVHSKIGNTLSFFEQPEIHAVVLPKLPGTYIVQRINRTRQINIIEVKNQNRISIIDLKLKQLPRKNGVHQLSIFAQDQMESKSAFYIKTIKIEKTPHIVLDKLKDHYEPGDVVTISGYAVDLDEGTEIKIYYNTQGSTSRKLLEKNPILKSKIYSNYTSGKFSFNYTVPEITNYKGIKIWAESNGKKVAELGNEKDVINYQPKIEIIADLKKEYYGFSSFIFKARIKDINKVKIFYFIDKNPEANLTDWIDCDGEVTINNLDILLPFNILVIGNHRVQIYAKDSNGDISNVFIHDFILTQKEAPRIHSFVSNAEKIFSINDVLMINFFYFNPNPGNTIKLCYTINNGCEIVINNGPNNFNFVNFTIDLPHKTNEIYVYIFDETAQVSSERKRLVINVEESPVVELKPVILTNSVDRILSTDDFGTIIESGDYDQPLETIISSNTQIQFSSYESYHYSQKLSTIMPLDTPIKFEESYYFEFGKNKFYIKQKDVREKLTIGQFIDDYIKVKTDGELKIILKKDGSKVIKTYILPLIFNEAPTFNLIKPLDIKMFESGYMDVLFNISDENVAYIHYQIDNDPINKGFFDKIELHGQTKTLRRQILTRLIHPQFTQHKITFFAVDDYGFKSKPIENTVYYYDSPPPFLELFEKPVSCNNNIAIQGSVISYLNDDISVYLQKEDFTFERIHYCPVSQKPQCLQFTYNVSKPNSTHNYTNTNTNNLIFHARGSQGAASKDITMKYKIIFDKCKLLERFVDNETKSKPKPTPGPDNSKGGKPDVLNYILWPLLAIIIIAIVAGVLYFFFFKKKEEVQNSNDDNNTEVTEYQHEPVYTYEKNDDVEQLEFISDDTSSEFGSTVNNPLYSIPTGISDDD